jgi:hypothetical protein
MALGGRKFSGDYGIIEIMKMNFRVMIVWRDWKRDKVKMK